MSVTSSRGSRIGETLGYPASIYWTWPFLVTGSPTTPDCTGRDRIPPNVPAVFVPIPNCYLSTSSYLASALHSGRLEQPRDPADSADPALRADAVRPASRRRRPSRTPGPRSGPRVAWPQARNAPVPGPGGAAVRRPARLLRRRGPHGHPGLRGPAGRPARAGH